MKIDPMDLLKLNTHLFGGFGCPKINDRAEKALRTLFEKYGTPDCGRNRATFFSKHCVIKFPLNNAGWSDNDWEASCRHETLARGRFIQIADFVCVIQEKLTMPARSTKHPSWVDGIDGGQVGYDRRGNLRAYDFGRH